MVEMTWPQFKHAHSGLENEEISKRWKRFKEGKYHMGDVKTKKQTSEEVPRDEDEVKELSKIQPVTLESDSVATQQIPSEAEAESEEGENGEAPSSSEPSEHIEFVKEHMVIEEEQPKEEPIEAPQSEETTPEVVEPTKTVKQPQNKKNNDQLAERLRDSIIYDI